MTEDIKARIDDKVKNNKVMLYMKGTPEFPQCGFSAHTVDILKSYGVPFASEDVLADPAIRRATWMPGGWDWCRAATSCTRCTSAGNWSRSLILPSANDGLIIDSPERLI